MIRKPPQDDPEYPPLAESAADIARKEQRLHREVGIFRVGTQKKPCNLILGFGTESSDACEHIQTFRSCACMRNCAIFGIGDICLILHHLKHRSSLLLMFIKVPYRISILDSSLLSAPLQSAILSGIEPLFRRKISPCFDHIATVNCC